MIKKRIAQTTKRVLASVIAFLVVIILVLAFRAGQVFWPTWLIEYRTQVIGIISLALLFTIVSSPIIIEANSNPRQLSGPGRDPRRGWGP